MSRPKNSGDRIAVGAVYTSAKIFGIARILNRSIFILGSKVVDLVRKRFKEELCHISDDTDEERSSSEDTNHSRDIIKRAPNKNESPC